MKKLLLNLMIITFLTGCSSALAIVTIPVGGVVGGVALGGAGAVAFPVSVVKNPDIPTVLKPIAAIGSLPVGMVVGAGKGVVLGGLIGSGTTLFK
jgi:hypothetical protein